jgi:hypothetical protein
VSYCPVINGEPSADAHGNALIAGAPPVERSASGAAFPRRSGLPQANDLLASRGTTLSSPTLLRTSDTRSRRWSMRLDPEAVLIGGALAWLIVSAHSLPSLFVGRSRRTW